MAALHGSGFKAEFDLERRVEVARKIKEKYPDRVPVIAERALNTTDVPECSKRKFLVPEDITVGMFVLEIRKHMLNLDPQKTIFLFIGNILPPSAARISEVYERYRDPDGFLYVVYSGENNFGAGASTAPSL